jgi:hypothetical protein
VVWPRQQDDPTRTFALLSTTRLTKAAGEKAVRLIWSFLELPITRTGAWRKPR